MCSTPGAVRIIWCLYNANNAEWKDEEEIYMRFTSISLNTTFSPAMKFALTFSQKKEPFLLLVRVIKAIYFFMSFLKEKKIAW